MWFQKEIKSSGILKALSSTLFAYNNMISFYNKILVQTKYIQNKNPFVVFCRHIALSILHRRYISELKGTYTLFD